MKETLNLETITTDAFSEWQSEPARLGTYRSNWEAWHQAVAWERSRMAQSSEISDNAEFDCTDAAHPAWWRGHQYTANIFCQLVNEILDGKKPTGGISNEPWESLKKRLYALAAPKRESGKQPSAKALEAIELNLFDILQIPGDQESIAYHQPKVTRLAKRIIEDYERHRSDIEDEKP